MQDLRWNQITNLEDNAFDGLSNLKELNLQLNQITTLEDNAFHGLSNLKTLVLSNNRITTVQDNAFAGLHNLSYLSLYRNQISAIPNNVFKELPNLKTLHIFSNNITTLDKNMFLGLPKLKTLSVERNPLHCDCILADFVRFSKSRKLTLTYIPYDIEPKCSTPSNLTGVLLRDLSSEDMNCDVTTATTPIRETSGKMIILFNKKH
ncbi:leucine-rich repeat transmembrane neuronal protein 2-like [Saccostrea cucullata]|uniref:leucine-rich repeat transmembrane neuronal protein 2-like n=1 Tax=Saccostrea cuccullata TaxID=36930 RepID=UPI002ECFE15B